MNLYEFVYVVFCKPDDDFWLEKKGENEAKEAILDLTYRRLNEA